LGQGLIHQIDPAVVDIHAVAGTDAVAQH
jgi:hypothetical protein